MKLLILIFLVSIEGKISIDEINHLFLNGSIANFNPPPLSKMKEGENCECVHYYVCNENGTIKNFGEDIIEIRLYDYCENMLEKCCERGDIMKTPPDIPLPSKSKGCGYRNPRGVGINVLDQEENRSQFGEFPWMLAILVELIVGETGEKLLIYKCGGSLIHPQVALTSAHCVHAESNEMKIRAGEWDTQNIYDIYPYHDRNVSKIITHPKFDKLNLEYDVALLILDAPLDMFAHIDTVCLPTADEIFSDNSRCFASGWGKDMFHSLGRYQAIMKKLELPMVPRNVCERLLQINTPLGGTFFLGNTFICAGGEKNKDTCTGDGGSPLVCPIPGMPNKYYQRGIVSWGVECGRVATPAVYTNVAMFRSWIDNELWKLNFSTYTYTY